MSLVNTKKYSNFMKNFCQNKKISGTMYDQNDKSYLMGYELQRRTGFVSEIQRFPIVDGHEA
jgi:hypothetical protein